MIKLIDLLGLLKQVLHKVRKKWVGTLLVSLKNLTYKKWIDKSLKVQLVEGIQDEYIQVVFLVGERWW